MRSLCRETRLKQIGCVHTSDTCEELCMYTHTSFPSLSPVFFPLLSSHFTSLPTWFRSSPFRAQKGRRRRRRRNHFDSSQYTSIKEIQKKTTYSVPVFSLFSCNTGKYLIIEDYSFRHQSFGFFVRILSCVGSSVLH